MPTKGGAKGQEWRNQVWARDGYKCQHCDTKEGLHAHHIVSWIDDETLRFDVHNGLTLCRSCHRKAEWKAGSFRYRVTSKLIGKPVWNKGKAHSDETKAKMAAAKIGKPCSNGFKKGVTSWNDGIPMKESTKDIFRKKFTGKKWIKDPETGKRLWIDNNDNKIINNR